MQQWSAGLLECESLQSDSRRTSDLVCPLKDPSGNIRKFHNI
jgi:hypothetical protein